MRREKSLRIGVHHADAVVRGPVRGERTSSTPASFASNARHAALAASLSCLSSSASSSCSRFAVASADSARSVRSRCLSPPFSRFSASSFIRASSPLSLFTSATRALSVAAAARFALASAVTVRSFSFWYPRISASCATISLRSASASSTETHRTSVAPLASRP
eukprot:30588-Pelagococcus_subviridis.AAC.1